MNPAILAQWLSKLATCTIPYSRVALHRYKPFGDAFSPLGILAEMAHQEKVGTRLFDSLHSGWEYDGLETLVSQRVMLWANLSHRDMTFILELSRRSSSHEEVAAVLSEHPFTPYELPIETEYYAHA